MTRRPGCSGRFLRAAGLTAIDGKFTALLRHAAGFARVSRSWRPAGPNEAGQTLRDSQVLRSVASRDGVDGHRKLCEPSADNPVKLLLRTQSSYLLLGLVIATILASPAVDSHPHFATVMAMFTVGSVLFAARITASRQSTIRVVLSVLGVWFLARLLEAVLAPAPAVGFAAHVAGLALSCTILWAISQRLGTADVTSSVIAEAFISYLVVAIAFGQVYWLLDQVIPRAFNQWMLPKSSSEYLYFSMNTLTCIGYDSITPVNPFVQIVAALESIVGIFYVAVIVARLVAAYRPQQP